MEGVRELESHHHGAGHGDHWIWWIAAAVGILLLLMHRSSAAAVAGAAGSSNGVDPAAMDYLSSFGQGSADPQYYVQSAGTGVFQGDTNGPTSPSAPISAPAPTNAPGISISGGTPNGPQYDASPTTGNWIPVVTPSNPTTPTAPTTAVNSSGPGTGYVNCGKGLFGICTAPAAPATPISPVSAPTVAISPAGSNPPAPVTKAAGNPLPPGIVTLVGDHWAATSGSAPLPTPAVPAAIAAGVAPKPIAMPSLPPTRTLNPPPPAAPAPKPPSTIVSAPAKSPCPSGYTWNGVSCKPPAAPTQPAPGGPVKLQCNIVRLVRGQWVKGC